MKWVTLICLLACTIVTESRYFHKRDAEHHTRDIGGIYTTIGKNNFRHLLLAMLAKLQQCTLEQQLKMVEEFETLAQHCADHKVDAECQKPLITLLHDKVCKHEHKYPWTTECCAKQVPEREKCFHDHRDVPVEPYKKPELDFVCKDLKENAKQAFNYYIYNIARRHSSLDPLSVLTFARQYHGIVIECCAEEHQEKCFETKFTEIHENILYKESLQKHVCQIINDFPERVFSAIKLSKLSQRYPGISFEVLHKLTDESVKSAKDCCKADMIECMIEKLELNQYMCENQERISPNLKACCEKPTLERTPCMYALPKDPVPEGLPKDINEFIDEQACKHFEGEKDNFLDKFLFDFSRRHQELSFLTTLRVSKGYEGLLTKCCADKHKVECLKSVPQLLEAGIKEAQDLVKQKCDAYEKLGPHAYNIELISDYVLKMPQVSDETILYTTGKMTDVGGKCCALPESQRYPCAEEKLDLLLGNMCEKQEDTFINDQVHHCCSDSYADRRPCFTKLGTDPSYKPPEFDENALQVGADICEGSEEEQRRKRLTLLIHVLKLKPNLPREKILKGMDDFTKVKEKCCAEAVHQLCFDRERPVFSATEASDRTLT